MPLIIPDDWDDQTWMCVQVQWPDSPMWRFLLRGFLTTPLMAGVWDRDSGSIVEARAVGWQIDERNTDLQLCDGTPVPPITPEEQQALSCLITESEDEMPCIDISRLLRIHNGTLQGLDNCCNWIDIGDIADVVKPPANTTPTDPVPADLACRKAFTIVNYLYAMGREAAVSATGFGVVNQLWYASFAAKYLQFKFNQEIATSFVLAHLKLAGIYGGTAWDGWVVASEQATLLCQWAKTVSADSLAVTETEMDALHTLIVSNIADNNLQWLFQGLVQLLGTTGLTWIALDGEHEEGANCDCPTPEEPPTPELPDTWTGYDWKHVIDLTARTTQPGHYAPNVFGAWHLASEGYPATGFWSSTSGDSRRVRVDILNEVHSGTVRQIAFKINIVAATEWEAETMMYVNAHQVAGGAQLPPGGIGWWAASCSQVIGESEMRADIPAIRRTNYNEPAYACGIIAIAFAGMGADPFTTDPDA